MTKRTKRLVRQWAIFVAGLLIVGGFLAYAVDWTAVAHLFGNGALFNAQFPLIITQAAKNTLIYTALAFTGGFVLGLVSALMRLSAVPPARWLATAYVEFFRGIPALVSILLVGFGIPIAFRKWDGVPQGLLLGAIALMLVAGAYLSETLRAGIQAVPSGQMEAARSLGMGPGQAMRHIILPQAVKIVIPPLTNELVLLLKDTSLLAILGVQDSARELTAYAQQASNDKANYTPLIAAAVLYLLISIPLSQVAQRLERRESRRKR